MQECHQGENFNNSSRAILYAGSDSDYEKAARAAAEKTRATLEQAKG